MDAKNRLINTDTLAIEEQAAPIRVVYEWSPVRSEHGQERLVRADANPSLAAYARYPPDIVL
jgi:hypothetical protein